ncbi:L,D-transpeptidase family protein [Xylocopilactobacillus apis]|uniref:L,D-TPase catalytic domain-containing protein n=1 Tax=Xylocopilactobacillus apis TaxID=2932183 RepID=A0AAU9D1T1_9LACO|nr:L,D-transpeptidase family protein [Xylocopilactobacillus apis]BDR56240.1 hypothetical protein KIMC2_08020 [Xylocopilactobacillus apis]
MKQTYSRKKTTKKNKKKIIRSPFLISILIGIICVTTFYFVYSLNYQNKFLPNTQVYGVDLSDQNIDRAAKKLHLKLDKMNFEVIEDGKTLYTINSKDIKLNKNYRPLLKKLLKNQDPASWGVKTFAFSDNSDSDKNNIKLNVQFDQKKLNSIEKEIESNLNKDRTAPQNAKLVLKNDKYKLVKQVEGNTISFKKLQKQIRNNIYNANNKIIVSENDYERPSIRENDSTLQKNFKQIKKIESTNLTYQVANAASIKVPDSEIVKWINYDGKSVDLNIDNIYDYISNINGNYTTIGATRNFQTTNSGKVVVKGGTYGRQISINDDVNQFKDALLNSKSGTIKATTIGQGQYESNVDNLGKTYVEVSKAKQHEWVYVNGKLFIQSDIVTGKPKNNNDTPTGTFVVWTKQTNTHLKGLNDDGSKYDSPVTYWMPIDYTGVGLHDSPWQPRYGGDWYVNNGSHGCVNNPPNVIAKFFDVIPIGTPVIIY